MDSISHNAAETPDHPTQRPVIVWTLLTAAFIAYGVLLAQHVGAYAGGADSSGYLNHARLLAEGHLHTPFRDLPEYKTAQQLPWLYTPLGVIPAANGHGLVPTYPVGLPLLLATTAQIVGWAHAGTVLLWLHGMAGVLLTCATGRSFGLSLPWSILATTLVAASPLYLFFSVTLMSDVPALVWGTAAVLAAWHSRRRPILALVAGITLAVGVLIRPTNALLIVPIAAALGMSRRRWGLLLLGGAPGGGLFLFHAHAAYGAYFASGYGDGAQVDWVWLRETLPHYGRWLPHLFTPLIVAFLGLPFVARGQPRGVFVLGSWVVVFLAFYAVYEFTHQTWWFLRYLLPCAPALAVGSILVLATALGHRFSATTGLIALGLTLTAVIGFDARSTEKLAALDSGRGERVYLQTSEWLLAHLPDNAVIGAMQPSGAIMYYTRFTQFRWDRQEPKAFEQMATALRRTGRPLYAALFPFEIDEWHAFTEHMAYGHWTKIGTVDQVTIWQWAPPS